jgi:aryl-alcohol dehydrogenase-like predicted oxidoreductase
MHEAHEKIMQTRKLGPFEVSAIGLGCMVLSHAYGNPPDPKTAGEVLLKALDLGYTHFDTATLYGFGANETLLGTVLKHRRKDYVLASKCGMFRGGSGGKEIDGHPHVLKQNLEDSLKRLQTDVIDLYYLHRWDKRIPIEDSIGAMSGMVKAGKVRSIGLSEVSAQTLRKAYAVHPIAAMQSEYSLWTRNPEIAVLQACSELGVAFVAFSPLARGFLTGDLRDPANLPPKDIRLAMPRFQAENFTQNLKLLEGFGKIAREHDCTMAQLALAWLLAKAPHIIPIPGTTRLDHLAENADAASVRLLPGAMERMETLIDTATVSGPRYNATQLPEIDTEGD